MHGLTIKLRSQRGIYVIHSQVNVLGLVKPVFYKEIDITVARVKNDSSSSKGRPSAVTGGKARVIVGCDNVFDRPLIIVEGFDPNNQNTIDNWLVPHYVISGVFTTMINQGYDLVFLDFNDASDYIQNNAQVLTSLINEVNRLKSGNFPLVVVGESMGGLVARYALTEFERQGRQHNVSHYISFDSPHRGAVVPIGIQTLILDVKASITINIADFFANILPQDLTDLANSADTPAAKQMLLRWKGPTPHPEFTAFQSDLQSRGFPQQCRNIAIVNGSIDPNAQPGGYVAGSEVINKNYVYILANVFIRAWTNSINQFDAVSSFYSYPFVPESSIRYFNLPVNYDLIPGGSKDGETINNNFKFAFVPTFSGIDYRGPLNTDGDFYISARNARANGFTPFAAVYGNNLNDEHVNVGAEASAWQNLFLTEFNASISSPRCNAQSVQAPPPLPQFSVPRLCGSDGSATEATVTTDPGLEGLFDFTWTVQPGNITVNGPSLFVSLNMLSSGAATITCTARSRQNPTVTSSFSQTIRACDQGYICAYQEGEFIYINASGVSYYARRYQGTQYASLSNGQFVPRSVLLANGVPSGVAGCFPETDPRGTTPPPSNPGNYEGFLDGADCNYIAGWVYDANNPNTSLNIEILDGSTVVATGIASNYRSDLQAAGKGNGQHGYQIATPTSLKNGQSHTLSVRVAGTTYTLTGSYQTINCGGTGGNPPNPPNPGNGNYEGHLDYAGCETIGGWVYDQNNSNAHLNIEVLTGTTVVATSTAANYRQDLQVAGKGNGEHGFTITTPETVKNGQNQSISVRVNGTSYILQESPRTINCAGTGNPPPPPPNPGNGNYEGHLDYTDCGSLGGWVYDQNNPNAHLNVDVLDGSTVVATGTAANFRQDLLGAGKGNGEHGLGITIPASLRDGQNHNISVRVSGTAYLLIDSPRSINCPSGGRLPSLEGKEVGTDLIVYPNPTTDQVTLAFQLDDRETAQITIVDVLGRIVYTARVVGEGKTHREPVSMRGQAGGTYLVRVVTNRRRLAGKVVVNR